MEQYLQLSEEALLVEIGKAAELAELGALPKSVAQLRQEGQAWVEDQSQKLKKALCGDANIKKAAGEGFSQRLVELVCTALEAAHFGTAITPVAVLLCRRGLSRLCSDAWGSSTGP